MSARARGGATVGGSGRRLLPPTVTLIAAAVIWQALGGVLPVSIATPSEIAAAYAENREVLWLHLTPTLTAAAQGFAVATVVSLLLAIVVVGVRRVGGVLYTTTVVIASAPLIALTPVLVVWLGTGSEVRLVIAALASFFPILVGMVQGLRTVDRRADELLDLLCATRWQRMRLLRVPSALPYAFAGLRAAAAAAVLGAIVSEWTGAELGLGVMMTYALFSFAVPTVWLTIVVSAACAIGFYGAVALVERCVVRWEHATVDLAAEGD